MNGENYPLPARNFKVKYPTRPGKKYEIPDPLDTRKFQKMKYLTCSIPGKSLPDPSLVYSRVIEFLRIFEFCNLHLMRGRLMLPDSISEEELKNGPYLLGVGKHRQMPSDD